LPVDLVTQRVRPESEPDRGDRRRGCCERSGGEDPATSKRSGPCGPFLSRRPEDAVPELRSRFRALGGVRELDRSLPEGRYRVAAALARVEMPFVGPAVLRVERVERVRRRQVVKFVQRNCLRA
jgi:hypothetical protein